ncbi:MAG: TMEM14 family protein [Simkaniaceae bacterium]|nr:TMEM14 family protein [Candidatus Sacchlamyda saccharinae]
MKTPAWITFIYGIIILLGGFMGYTQAASTTSLIMGLVFGVLLLIAAGGMLKNHLLPAYFGIILILLLDAFFTYRWLFTFQFIPAGLLSIISTIVLIAVVLLIRKHLEDERNK